jgi:5-methylcytosine-specific restriction endonuclease McrA
MDIKTVTKNEMVLIIKKSKSLKEIIETFGLSTNGSSSYNNIKKKIKELELEIPIYHYYGNGKHNIKKEDVDVFIENSNYPRQKLKKRIIDNNLIIYTCSECGNKGTHNNKNLILQLDHINGINNDNRIENLRFLCPNCHSQTENYGGKSNIGKYNKIKLVIKKQRPRKVERPNFEVLLNDIKILGYCGTGRKYGVSDNAIRKWKKYFEEK